VDSSGRTSWKKFCRLSQQKRKKIAADRNNKLNPSPSTCYDQVPARAHSTEGNRSKPSPSTCSEPSTGSSLFTSVRGSNPPPSASYETFPASPTSLNRSNSSLSTCIEPVADIGCPTSEQMCSLLRCQPVKGQPARQVSFLNLTLLFLGYSKFNCYD
jgi:hypothetical protein